MKSFARAQRQGHRLALCFDLACFLFALCFFFGAAFFFAGGIAVAADGATFPTPLNLMWWPFMCGVMAGRDRSLPRALDSAL